VLNNIENINWQKDKRITSSDAMPLNDARKSSWLLATSDWVLETVSWPQDSLEGDFWSSGLVSGLQSCSLVIWQSWPGLNLRKIFRLHHCWYLSQRNTTQQLLCLTELRNEREASNVPVCYSVSIVCATNNDMDSPIIKKSRNKTVKSHSHI
jgi:hypothetical protein